MEELLIKLNPGTIEIPSHFEELSLILKQRPNFDLLLIWRCYNSYFMMMRTSLKDM